MRFGFDKTGVKKKKKGRASASMIPKLLMGLMVLFLLAAAVGIYFNQEAQFARIREKSASLADEAAQAREELKEFQNLYDQSDSLEYIEKVAREELGMVKPGETVFPD